MHPWELGDDIAGYIITQKFVPLFNAFVKVLNWGLGPHEDQTAEMVLIGPLLTQKSLFSSEEAV